MNKLVFISLLAIAIMHSSCYNCGGADTIRSLSGITLNPTTDSLTYSSQQALVLHFMAGNAVASRPGDRKCHRKNLVIKYENTWQSNEFRLYCNRYFVFKTDTIHPYTNLLSSPICDNRIKVDIDGHLSSESEVFLMNFEKPVLNTNYIFRLEGITNDNKIFKDSCSIYIQ